MGRFKEVRERLLRLAEDSAREILKEMLAN